MVRKSVSTVGALLLVVCGSAAYAELHPMPPIDECPPAKATRVRTPTHRASVTRPRTVIIRRTIRKTIVVRRRIPAWYRNKLAQHDNWLASLQSQVNQEHYRGKRLAGMIVATNSRVATLSGAVADEQTINDKQEEKFDKVIEAVGNVQSQVNQLSAQVKAISTGTPTPPPPNAPPVTPPPVTGGGLPDEQLPPAFSAASSSAPAGTPPTAPDSVKESKEIGKLDASDPLAPATGPTVTKTKTILNENGLLYTNRKVKITTGEKRTLQQGMTDGNGNITIRNLVAGRPYFLCFLSGNPEEEKAVDVWGDDTVCGDKLPSSSPPTSKETQPASPQSKQGGIGFPRAMEGWTPWVLAFLLLAGIAALSSGLTAWRMRSHGGRPNRPTPSPTPPNPNATQQIQ